MTFKSWHSMLLFFIAFFQCILMTQHNNMMTVSNITSIYNSIAVVDLHVLLTCWSIHVVTYLYEGRFSSGHLYHSTAQGPDICLREQMTAYKTAQLKLSVYPAVTLSFSYFLFFQICKNVMFPSKIFADLQSECQTIWISE